MHKSIVLRHRHCSADNVRTIKKDKLLPVKRGEIKCWLNYSCSHSLSENLAIKLKTVDKNGDIICSDGLAINLDQFLIAKDFQVV